MDDVYDRIEELMDQATELPYGPVRIAMLEEACQLADSTNDVDLAYDVRSELTHSATFSGRFDLALISFSWCLAQFDRNPDRFDEHTLLWQYKWIIGNGAVFPQITRRKLEELVEDMDRRYRKAGSTMHAVTSGRRNLALHFGDLKAAQVANAEFRKCRRDNLSNCAACVASENCDYHNKLGQWTRAIQSVRPVLDKRLSCAEEPHRALSRVLLPLLHLGRVDEALEHQRQGYRLISRVSHFVREHADHLQFLVLVGQYPQAKRLFERNIKDALESVCVDERFRFFLSSRLWCDRLTNRGTKKLKIQLPPQVALKKSDGGTEISELGNWCTEQAKEIARQFDSRNGNKWFQSQIDDLPKMMELAID